MLIVFDTATIPQQSFSVKATRSSTDKPAWMCPAPEPKWIGELLKAERKLQFEDVVLQAGRHFSDKVNLKISSPGTTKRQLATGIAWAILSMIRPYVKQDRLYVIDPIDKDVKRLCSEVLGVGVALEFLTRHCGVDGRTIRKIGSRPSTKPATAAERFDYEAFGINGGQLILIEAKGTFSNAYSTGHRSSIADKIQNLGLPRGYDRAIGIICSTWVFGEKRLFDVQICDPEREPEDRSQEAVREVIRFYAKRFDEAVGRPDGTRLLYRIAEHENLFDRDVSLPELEELHPDPRKPVTAVWHNRVELKHDGLANQYWGNFWLPDKLPIPLQLNVPSHLEAHSKPEDFKAFMGIDRRIFDLIHKRDFGGLLSYRADSEGLWHSEAEEFAAVFHVDTYGVVRGLVAGELPWRLT